MKRIAIIPNYTKDKDAKYTKKLCEYLKGKAELVMKECDRINGISASFTSESPYDGADAVIVLGGDGTILNVAEPCGKKGIPVVGINLGKVGFMAEVEKEDIASACDRLLADDFCVQNRMMMEISVTSEGNMKRCYTALNDAVISRKNAQMAKMELYAGEEKISEYTADGLIISTPTGSTGYSLSAGGPVADPAMQLFIATPICAHTLSSRPMLMSAEKAITLKLTESGSSSVALMVDGNEKCVITPFDTVEIRRSEYVLKLIKLGKQSFYYTMMAKL